MIQVQDVILAKLNGSKVMLPILIGLLSITLPLKSNSQCLISKSSSRGYDVDISLEPDSLIKPSTCPLGYNYNVRIKYDVKFSGSNIPSNLNTLKAYLYCGTSSLYYAVPKTQGSGKMISSGNIWRGNSDCSASSLKSLGCDSFAVHIQGPGIPNKVLGCAFSLPVHFIRFEVERIKNTASIIWATAFESNHKYFIIQRSKNGREWINLDTIFGEGNSHQIKQYKYMDTNLEARTYYYQIRQVDFDGRYSYTLVKKIKAEGVEFQKVHSYPNPCYGKLRLDGIVHDIPIQLFSMSGVEVHGYTKINSGTGTVELDLNKVKEGVYMLRILQKSIRVVLMGDERK